MIQALEKPISFDEFIEWLPEATDRRYELRRGTIVEMPKARGKHSDIAGWLMVKLGAAIELANLPYFTPRECIVKADEGDSGYEPDGIVLNRVTISDDPRWERESVIENGTSIKLIIEVVSTNWRDDYGHKFVDYEALGIPEYWIVDYLGLGGKRHIGTPKQPTLSVCELVDGEYQITQFRGCDRVVSPTFPDLQLTAEQILRAGQ